jgi:hypothetical protein
VFIVRCRETLEESPNFIHISVDSLRKCPKYIHGFKKRKLCYYFVGINFSDIDLSLFRTNRNIIRKEKGSQCWKEKQAIKIFYISDIQNISSTESTKLGNDLFISPRYSFLPGVLNDFISKNQIPCLNLTNKVINDGSTLNFLNGTASFIF